LTVTLSPAEAAAPEPRTSSTIWSSETDSVDIAMDAAWLLVVMSVDGVCAPKKEKPGMMKNKATTASASAVAIPVCVGFIMISI